MSKIYLEILDKDRQKIFNSLSAFRDLGYLGGGTALALQIKHRKSFDFDIFLPKPVNNRLRLAVSDIFGDVKFSMDTEDQLIFRTDSGVSITFLWYYFNHLNPLVETESLKIASILDISADKAYTIGRRSVWRDYVDIYFLLKKNFVDLRKIINLADKKFKGAFNEALFLEQLVYFKDLEVAPIEFLDEKPKAAEIKIFLEKQVKDYLGKNSY